MEHFSKTRFQYFKFDAPFKCWFFFTSILPAPDALDWFLCNTASDPAPPGFEDCWTDTEVAGGISGSHSYSCNTKWLNYVQKGLWAIKTYSMKKLKLSLTLFPLNQVPKISVTSPKHQSVGEGKLEKKKNSLWVVIFLKITFSDFIKNDF